MSLWLTAINFEQFLLIKKHGTITNKFHSSCLLRNHIDWGLFTGRWWTEGRVLLDFNSRTNITAGNSSKPPQQQLFHIATVSGDHHLLTSTTADQSTIRQRRIKHCSTTKDHLWTLTQQQSISPNYRKPEQTISHHHNSRQSPHKYTTAPLDSL